MSTTPDGYIVIDESAFDVLIAPVDPTTYLPPQKTVDALVGAFSGSIPTPAPGVSPELAIVDGGIAWRYPGGQWTTLIALSELEGADSVVPGTPGLSAELRKTATAIQWRQGTDGTWVDLVPLSEITGPAGSGEGGGSTDPAREVELAVVDGYIAWRYVGDTAWTNLVATSDLRGTDGDDGDDALQVSLAVVDGAISWQRGAGPWVALATIASLTGANGKQVELRRSATAVEWRLGTDGTWAELVPLSSLKGADSTVAGPGTEIRTTSTAIEWRAVGSSTWTQIATLASLKGADSTVAGPAGKSAYQAWLDAGNTGTEAAFVASLKGAKGDSVTGPTGPQGPPGQVRIVRSGDDVSTSLPGTLLVRV